MILKLISLALIACVAQSVCNSTANYTLSSTCYVSNLPLIPSLPLEPSHHLLRTHLQLDLLDGLPLSLLWLQRQQTLRQCLPLFPQHDLLGHQQLQPSLREQLLSGILCLLGSKLYFKPILR